MLTFLDILIALLTLAITVIPLFKNVMLRPKVYPPISFLRRITQPGWTVIGLGLLLIGVVFLKDWYFNKEKGKDETNLVSRISKNFVDSLKKYNLQYDPKTGQVIGRKIQQLS